MGKLLFGAAGVFALMLWLLDDARQEKHEVCAIVRKQVEPFVREAIMNPLTMYRDPSAIDMQTIVRQDELHRKLLTGGDRRSKLYQDWHVSFELIHALC